MTITHTSPSGLETLASAWDFVVVGAGPAGAAAACRAASRGISTLLVERRVFPREKVCGGCLSPAGMDALEQLGLACEAARIGAPIRLLEVHARGRSAGLALGFRGVALAREKLDWMMARGAARAGACVLDGVSARLVRTGAGGSTIALTSASARIEVMARVVLGADGLDGSFLPRDGAWKAAAWPWSRIGLGTRVPACDAEGLGFPEPGVVAMHFGSGGYVGLVRLADGSIDAAAAVDPVAVRSAGSAGAAVDAIMLEAGAGDGGIGPDVRWHGTPALTRRRIVERGAVFAAGDAAGYVEPLTGEGMSWAIRGGIGAADHASAWLAGRARAGDWTRATRKMFRSRHWGCAAVALGARSPRLVSGVARAAGVLPMLSPVMRGLCAGPWRRCKTAGDGA